MIAASPSTSLHSTVRLTPFGSSALTLDARERLPIGSAFVSRPLAEDECIDAHGSACLSDCQRRNEAASHRRRSCCFHRPSCEGWRAFKLFDKQNINVWLRLLAKSNQIVRQQSLHQVRQATDAGSLKS